MLQRYFPPPGRGPTGAPPGSSLDLLRRVDRAAKWDPLGFPQRLAHRAAVPLWPLVALVSCLCWQVPRLGPRARRESGRPLVRQVLDQMRLAATLRMWPHQYYVFELFRPGRMELAWAYLLRAETKRGIFSILKDAPRKNPIFARKDVFAEACAAAGLAHAQPIATVSSQGIAWHGDRCELPAEDLFIKPVQSQGGRGGEIWRWRDGRYAGAAGALTGADLLTRLRARRDACVVMPRLVNHASLAGLALDTLSTLRILTCRDEAERPEVIAAVLRFPRGRDAIVDNFHAGGLAAGIEIETGRLGPATDLGLARDSRWHERHPVSGAQIAGCEVPFWAAALALAEAAHDRLGDRVVIGWDIAVLPDGPMLIEANGFPDLDILQRCAGAPLGASRFCDLLAHHLRRAYPIWRQRRGLRPD